MRRRRNARAGSEPLARNAFSVPGERLVGASGPAQQIGADRRHECSTAPAAGRRPPRRVRQDPRRNPSRKPIASARLARATGESVDLQQPVVGRADRRPVGLLPAGRRRVQRRDHRLRQIRSRRTRGQPQPLQPAGDPAAVPLRRSCSSSGTSAPSASTRVRRRESCSSTRAASACASRESGISAHSSPASRTPSSHSSSRIADGPAVDQ